MSENIFEQNSIIENKDSSFIQNFKANKKDFKSFVDLYKLEVFTFLFLMIGDYNLAIKNFVTALRIDDNKKTKSTFTNMIIKSHISHKDKCNDWKH